MPVFATILTSKDTTPEKAKRSLRIASLSSIAPTISPSINETQFKRRKREAIELPFGLAAAELSGKEVKRLKNRIAATRLRQRSQQDVRSLQEQRKYYKTRCEFLDIVVSGCGTCASLGAMHCGEFELIPAETKTIKIESELALEIEDDGESAVLTEAECVVLDSVLRY
ncbi:unnamed protein product [Peronospora effusa]|nr:unnamed protein product [Peronospora effusa]